MSILKVRTWRERLKNMKFLPYFISGGRDSSRETSAPAADAFWGLDTTGGDDEYIEDKVGSSDLLRNNLLKVVESPVSDSYWNYSADSNSHATIVDSALVSMPDADFMWVVWARLASSGVARTVLSKGVRGIPATFEYAIYVNDAATNRYVFAVGNGSQARTVTDTNIAIGLGEWHMIACRFNKTTMKLGINVDMSGWVEAAFSGTVHDDTNDLYVGIEYPSSLRWDGAINMVALEKSLLSDEQLNFWWREGVGWRIPVLS